MLCIRVRLCEMKSNFILIFCISDSSSDIICVCVDVLSVVIGLLVMISCGLVVRVWVMVSCWCCLFENWCGKWLVVDVDMLICLRSLVMRSCWLWLLDVVVMLLRICVFIVCWGFSEFLGFWKIICSCVCSIVWCCYFSGVMCCLLNVILLVFGVLSFVVICVSDDLL